MIQKKSFTLNLSSEEKLKLALRLNSPAKFYLTYFEYLPKFDTQKNCFEYLNKIYMEIYGEYRYSCYESFYMYMHRKSKK